MIIHEMEFSFMDNNLKSAIEAFNYEGEYVTYGEIKAGIINATYKITYKNGGVEKHYILQKINTNVFRNPEGLMDNVSRVTAHIRAKLDENDPDYERRVLRILTANGKYTFYDADGNCWRSYVYVDNATAHNAISDPTLFYEAGKGFGAFQKDLFDFPAEMLSETIPNFHNTKSRFDTFEEAIKNDAAGRVKDVMPEIEFVRARRDLASSIVDRLASGELPIRVTHNDTKLNNILIDDQTKKAICVIDLDTIMPGSSLYDFGDAIRFGANTAAEDEPDTSKIDVNMDLFKLFTKGFVEECAQSFDKSEIRLLPLGALVMTYELVIRFLTDYINGDTYFKTLYPEHNIVRTRAQMKLLESLEAKLDQMNAFVESMLA